MKRDFLQDTYGLKSNPFVNRVATELQLGAWYDREEQLEHWKKIISPPINSNKIAIIIGDYGRGKSLSLLKIIDEAKKHSEIFSIYTNLKTEEKSKPGLDFMLRIFRSINFDKLVENRGDDEIKDAIEKLPNDFDEAKIILEKICLSEIEPEMKKAARYFLRGEVKPSPTQLKHLGIMRKMESIDLAKEYLAAILAFMKGLKYEALLACIDEFEYLFSLVTKGQQSIYLALLRGLYDMPTGLEKNPGNMAKIIFFVAVSEAGWSSFKEIEAKEKSIGGPTIPLSDRIESKLSLGPFNKDQTRKLIEKRLSFDRASGNFEDRPLIPFTKDFVDFIYERTMGEPRKIIVNCSHVLDAGLGAKIHLISKDFAEKALRDRGL